MANRIVIAELDIDIDALIKSTAELKRSLDAVKKQQSDLQKAGDTSSEQFIQNAADIRALSSAYNQNVRAISDVTQATADQINRTQLLSLALDQEATSIAEAREQNKILTKLRNEANLATEEGRAELEALNAMLDRNNEFIRENADAYTQQKINIGNYKDAISESLGELNIMNGGLGGFIERSNEAGGAGNLLTGSLRGAASGFLGMAKAGLAFIATPIGAVIAALVAAFALIKAAMNRSEDATNKLKVAFSAVTGIFNLVMKALAPLGEFLIDGIVMGFELAGKAAEAAAGLIADGLSFLGFDDAAKGVRDFTDEIKAGVKDAQDLAKAEQALETSQRKSRLTQLEYQKVAERFRQIRDDENRSIGERIKANEDLGNVLKQQLRDELAIAQQALTVANLRIKAEGSTKETLDAQADALTEIADIQERITGQESEQLSNRVSLQKEAAQKAAEIREKNIQNALAKSRQEIDLFVAQQGFKKKSLEDEYNFNKALADKELADSQLRFKNGKLSKTEFETEKLNIANEFAKRNAEITIENAQLELDAALATGEAILNNDKFLSEELLKQKKEALTNQMIAETEFNALRLEQGIINQQEYNAAIDSINEENKIKNDELALERKEAETEQRLLDIENRRAAEALTFEEDLALQIEKNDIARNAELANAEKTGADKSLIVAKYDKVETDLKRATEAAKLDLLQAGLSGAKGFLKENTAAYKAMSIAEATINTYKAASLALSTYAYPIGGIFAGLAIAQGLMQVSKIAGAKLEKGGIVGVGGKRHAQGGTKFYGEDGTTFEAEAGEGIGVLNRKAFSSFMDFNNSFNGGSSSGGYFQGGGIITQGVRPETPNLDIIADTIAAMPAPVVAVDEIQRVGTQYVSVKNGADLE